MPRRVDLDETCLSSDWLFVKGNDLITIWLLSIQNDTIDCLCLNASLFEMQTQNVWLSQDNLV